jgi:DNA modification methylase
MTDEKLTNLMSWVRAVNKLSNFTLLYWTTILRISYDMDQLKSLGFKATDWFQWNKIRQGSDKHSFGPSEVCIVASIDESGFKKPSFLFGQHLSYAVPQYIKVHGTILNGAQKSLKLMLLLLKHYSKPGGNVLDVFAGTG